MKVILYIVALLTLAAAAYFVQDNIQRHQSQLDQTRQLEQDNTNIKAEIKKVEAQLREAIKLKEEKTKEKNGRDSDLLIRNNNLKDEIKHSKGFDSKLASLREKQAEVDEVIARIEKVFEKENISIDNVGARIEELENQRKQLNKEHGDLIAEVERYTADVAVNNGTINDFNKAQTKRRQNLKANGVSSLITSVDNDWGFVIVKPHADSGITVDSKLIVVRGANHVGRLNINAIEDGRVLANIDYSSLVPGMRIRAGDRVILSKVRTN